MIQKYRRHHEGIGGHARQGKTKPLTRRGREMTGGVRFFYCVEEDEETGDVELSVLVSGDFWRYRLVLLLCDFSRYSVVE